MDPPILAIQLAIRSMECVVPPVSFFRSSFRTAYAERLAGSLTPRRFPPPWSVEELQACFLVKDSAGQKLVIQI
jgi:hypothetical protein